MAPPATPRGRRLLLDTNAVVGALLWSGPPLRLMEQAVEDGIELISSPVRVLARVAARALPIGRSDGVPQRIPKRIGSAC